MGQGFGQMLDDRAEPLENVAVKIMPAIFEEREIRRLYDEKTETWFFSVVDIIQVLTQQPDYQAARNYWKVLKNRLAKEGSQLVTNCNQLKLTAADGKSYLTDVANAENLLRLVQSVPSPKAEPIKLWLAKVGYERMQEMSDPARALERARATWQKQGEEYAILTNLIHQEWSGVGVKAHKDLKGLKTQNLRDHMSEAELIFTALAELSTRQIAETTDATGMPENRAAAKTGGKIAKRARLDLETQTGKRIVTGENFLPPGDAKTIRE